jgi:hypothetical protein
MNDPHTTISDLYICEAFKEILTTPPAGFQQVINTLSYQDIITFLVKLPPGDRSDPGKMANHIASFCEQPGRETLQNWLGEIYDRLDGDGIDKLVKKTGDPGDEADDEPKKMRLIVQKSRDICQELQQIVAAQTQSNPTEAK